MTDLEFAVSLLPAQVLSPWQRAFVVGCKRRFDAGRCLTVKQLAVLKTLAERSVFPEFGSENGTNGTGTGSRARVTESERCSVPISVPFRQAGRSVLSTPESTP